MIAIIGAGISGLTLAYELEKAGKPYVLVDESEKSGGKIRTVQKEGYLLDTGPNTLLADDSILDFLKEIELENEICEANPVSKNRFIFRNGTFHGLSPNPIKLIFTGLLSWKAKWNIWSERNVPSQSIENETFAQFVRRRFSAEILDWVATPVQYGIHAADPEKLLVSEAFPGLVQNEKKYGSVLRGLMATKDSNRQRSVNFRNGMEVLPKAIVSKLSNFRPNVQVVKAMSGGNGKWRLEVIHKGEMEAIEADQVVFCIPSFQAANILADFKSLSTALRKIKYNSMAILHTSIKKVDNVMKFNGFGGLIPAKANLFSAGSIWASSVFDGRAPEGRHLIAQFIGGALRPHVALLSDAEVKERISPENEIVYGVKYAHFEEITRWKDAIPQYDLECKNANIEIKANVPDGVFFLANWKNGVSLSDCIRNAQQLSREI